jgi:hypothetical protein
VAGQARDPHEAIREAENALRDLIFEVLEPALGEGWLEQSGLTPERLGYLQQRNEEEQKRRHLQRPEERLLYYADLGDLRNIVDKNWEKFKPVLRDKSEFRIFMDKLEDLRNPDAHQRGLWPYEIDLAFGISGQMRQALAVSRRRVDDLNKYYPRFERVTDNFGFTVTDRNVTTGKTVRPGDRLTYRISAWNPDSNHPLEFCIAILLRMVTDWTTDDVISCVLTDEDIDRTMSVDIRLRGERGKKRGLNFDEAVAFYYVGVPE